MKSDDLNLGRRQTVNAVMLGLTGLCAAIALSFLFGILGYIAYHGFSALSWDFLVNLPKPVGETGGGIANSIVGTAKVVGLAALMGVGRQRFPPRDEECVLCGLCVRMCKEQMMAGAIDFVGRGAKRRITTPFDKPSQSCRRCGGCMYVCPACTLRCHGPKPPTDICGSCMSVQPTCVEPHDDLMCYMGTTGSCGTCIRK